MSIAFSFLWEVKVSHFIYVLIKCVLFSFYSAIQLIIKLLCFSHNKKFNLKKFSSMLSNGCIDLSYHFECYFYIYFNAFICCIIFHFILKITFCVLNLIFHLWDYLFWKFCWILVLCSYFELWDSPLAYFMSVV